MSGPGCYTQTYQIPSLMYIPFCLLFAVVCNQLLDVLQSFQWELKVQHLLVLLRVLPCQHSGYQLISQK